MWGKKTSGQNSSRNNYKRITETIVTPTSFVVLLAEMSGNGATPLDGRVCVLGMSWRLGDGPGANPDDPDPFPGTPACFFCLFRAAGSAGGAHLK